MNIMSEYDVWMEAAFAEAKIALDKGEVPIGCVFVHGDEIVGKGRNTVNETKNATRHAEINALDDVFSLCEEKGINLESFLQDCTLYVTVEPCVMCAEALGQLKLGKLVFGCSNDRFGGCGSIADVAGFYDKMEVVKGIKANEAVQLLKEFYRGENPNAPTAKVKLKVTL